MAELGKNRRGKKYIIAATLMIAVWFLFRPAMLSAEQVALPETGQTRCYDTNGTEVNCTNTGQDGDVQAGVDWPDPRFTDNGDGTISDNLSGLMWTKDAQVAGDYNFKTWEEALDYVADMNDGTLSNFGYTDWRLPNILDLFSLSNLEVSSFTDWLIDQGFTNVYPSNFRNFYWSSTTLASMPERGWIFNVLSVSTWAAVKSTAMSVWPVRGELQDDGDPDVPASIRKTGQTSCYDASGEVIDCAGTGQDGDTQAGVAWPEPRFVDNGDGTVTDRLTGLMWVQAPREGGQKTWQESLDYIADEENLPAFKGETDGVKGGKDARQSVSDYIAGLNGEGNGGGAGWHLANANELMSLIDFSGTSSLVPPGSPISNPGRCWSSNTTPMQGMEDTARSIGFYSSDFGVMFDSAKDSTNIAWAVSDGGDTVNATTDANHPSSGNSDDPVNTYTGELFFSERTELFPGGPLPLYFQRYYASYLARDFIVGDLGDNWRHNFEWSLHWNGNRITVISNRGKVLKYSSDGQGTWTLLTNKTNIPYQIVQAGQEIYLGDPQNNLIYRFNAEGKLAELLDGKGNVFTLSYHTVGDDYGKLDQVTDGLGRILEFNHTTVGSLRKLILVQAKYGDTYQQSVSFAYNESGDDLISATDPMGRITAYEYEDTSGTADRALMLRRTLPEGNSPYTQTYYGTDNQYSSGRVETQTDANGNTHTFVYNSSGGASVTGSERNLSLSAGDTTMTDPLGNGLSHTHNEDGELTANQRQDGGSSAVAYDANGRRSSVTDLLGDTTTYTYHEASGKLAQVINADGTSTTYTYAGRSHSSGVAFYDLTATTYPDNTTETFAYDAAGNMTSRTDRSGNTWVYTYNSRGQVLTITNPAGGVTTNSYNGDGTPASATDHAGNTTGYGYDALKRLATITRADGGTRTFTYDDNNNLLSETDERGNTTRFTYDNNNNINTVTDRLGKTTVFAYDGMDRVVSVTDPLGNVSNRTYDELGRAKRVTDPNGNATTYGYDSRGRLTSITDGGGKIWGRMYDAESIIASTTDPLLNTAYFASDKMGRITQSTSPLSHVTDVTYDSMGRVTARENPLNETTSFSYDARGLLAGRSMGEGITVSYTRNELGLITAVTDPRGNGWLRGYDPQGRRASHTDPLGSVTSYEYDSRNRVNRVNLPAGSLDLAYDDTGNVLRKLYSNGTDLSYTYDEEGRLTSADGVSLAYDADGRMTNSNGLALTRDGGGRITSMTLAAGKTITYGYDSRDLLTNVTDWLGGSMSFTYDDAGQVTSIARPNGVTTTYGYDNDGRVIEIQEGSVSSIGLARDGKGQVTAVTRTLPSEPTIEDSINTLSYDAAFQVSSYIYDNMGHLTDDGTRTYTWDLASRLTSYTEGSNTVGFTYDAMGNRLSRTEGSTVLNYVWNYALGLPSINVVQEGGSDRRYYIYSPAGNLIYSINASDNGRSFYHFDQMGNTLFLTDDTGAVSGSYGYGPYGKIFGSTGSLDNSFTWQGKFGVMQEGNSGLYYMRARYYDSETGRFVSRDPVRGIGPKSINPYQYALGNPLRFADPMGRNTVSEAIEKAKVAKGVSDAARREYDAACREYSAACYARSDGGGVWVDACDTDRAAILSYLNASVERQTGCFPLIQASVDALLADVDAVLARKAAKARARNALIAADAALKALDAAKEAARERQDAAKRAADAAKRAALKLASEAIDEARAFMAFSEIFTGGLTVDLETLPKEDRGYYVEYMLPRESLVKSDSDRETVNSPCGQPDDSIVPELTPIVILN